MHFFLTLDDLLYAARFGLFAPYPDPHMIREVRTPYAALHGRLDGSDFIGTAVYMMKLLWAKAYQQKIIATKTANIPTFSTGVPVLDVTAMRSSDGRGLSLVLTNAGMERLHPTIALREFKPKPSGKLLIVSGDLKDDNRWESRSRVVLQESDIQTAPRFELPLPPHSITAVLMTRA
jgi:hypothetical protein